MGKYRLSNINIRTASNNNEYMTASMMNTETGIVSNFITFNATHISLIKPYLHQSKGGTAKRQRDIPEEFIEINGLYTEYRFPIGFFKKYTNGPKEGQYYRNIDGTIRIFNSMIVFCQYYIQENGEKEFLRNESPAEKFYSQRGYSWEQYSKEKELLLNQRIH